MSNLGPDYVGKLPPGASKDLNATLRQCRKLEKDGIIKGVKILPGPGCAVAEAQIGTVYSVDQVPKLPLPDAIDLRVVVVITLRFFNG